ncbi:hypothetical protein BASA81_003570 [Batrachochytrium salamandrivorans]|nr:hypothetical protein BASA81_003570 [Batrachochytrium salamandrivorans]
MKRVSKAFSRATKQDGPLTREDQRPALPPKLSPTDFDLVNNENAPHQANSTNVNRRMSIRRSLAWKVAAPPTLPPKSTCSPPPLPPPLMAMGTMTTMTEPVGAPLPPPRMAKAAPPPLPPRMQAAELQEVTKHHEKNVEEEEEEEDFGSAVQFKTLGPTIAQAKRKQWMPSMFATNKPSKLQQGEGGRDEKEEEEEAEGGDAIDDALPSINGSSSKSAWRFSAMRRMSLTKKKINSDQASTTGFHLIPPNESLVTMPMLLNEEEMTCDEDSYYSYGVSAIGRFNELPSALYFESATHAEHPADPDFPLSAIIILSLGEAMWMCGPASLDYPEARFPAICGKPHKHLKKVELAHNSITSNSSSDGSTEPDRISFGCDAERKKLLDLEWFNDTDNGQQMPKYVLVGDALVYNSDHLLRRPLKQDAVLLPINQEYTMDRKNKLAMLCFERIGARAVRVCSEELMALQYLTQRPLPTGMVVDMGQTATRVVCFLQGERVEITLRKTKAAGKAVTLRMQRMMQELESVFTQSKQGMEFARLAKEKVGFVRQRLETKECAPVSVEYSPGNFVLLQQEMHQCAEILFNPSADEGGMLAYANAPSVQTTLMDCLKENDDRDTWEELLSNIVVYGGTSRLPGMEARLTQEVRLLLDSDPMTASKSSVLKRKLKVRVLPEAAWAGARELLERESLSPVVPNPKWISRMYWKNGGETGVKVRLEKLCRGDETFDAV